jgi:hypothetical protein
MILLDTNVLIYASDPEPPFCTWARNTIADAVAGDGTAINAVVLAELCVGDADPPAVADRVRGWGVAVLDLPAAAAGACAEVYRQFRERRQMESGQPAPTMPLPDFFIGAHALIMGWELATADQGRFRICFPTVPLKTPK